MRNAYGPVAVLNQWLCACLGLPPVWVLAYGIAYPDGGGTGIGAATAGEVTSPGRPTRPSGCGQHYQHLYPSRANRAARVMSEAARREREAEPFACLIIKPRLGDRGAGG